MHSNSPNAGVAVTVVAGGPSGAVAVSTTASTAAATTTTSVGVTGLYLKSVCFVNPVPEVNLTAGAVGVTVSAETIVAPLGAVVGGSCRKSRISTHPSISTLTQSISSPRRTSIPPSPTHPLSIRATPTTSLENFHVPGTWPAAALGSAPGLRFPVRWTGLSMTLTGGSGSLLGSSSRSLPLGVMCQRQSSFP
jgi:hypothetical protein